MLEIDPTGTEMLTMRDVRSETKLYYMHSCNVQTWMTSNVNKNTFHVQDKSGYQPNPSGKTPHSSPLRILVREFYSAWRIW